MSYTSIFVSSCPFLNLDRKNIEEQSKVKRKCKIVKRRQFLIIDGNFIQIAR